MKYVLVFGMKVYTTCVFSRKAETFRYESMKFFAWWEALLLYSLALNYKLLKGSEPKGNIVKKRWWDILPSNFKLTYQNFA
jgi:hypothetical protein